MDRLMFIELLNIMKENLDEELYIRPNGSNAFVITDDGLNIEKEDFTQINFRLEGNSFIIPWFYISKHNKGIGSRIIQWFIEFCTKNDIEEIEIRGVKQDKEGMKNLLNKFNFSMIKSGEFMDFRKEL